MITIPTSDLTGLLADVVPFALDDKDLPMLNCVRLEWDGELLHALSTDQFRIAWSTWSPDDDPDEEAQDDLFTEWGGTDEPWVILLPLDDAKELVKVYKLPTKEGRVPLTVETSDGQVSVKRARETGYSAITTTMRGVTAEFPDVRALLAKNDGLTPITGLAYTAKWVADFARVRPRGPMELRFCGVDKPTHVLIGKRFCGAIMPVKLSSDD